MALGRFPNEATSLFAPSVGGVETIVLSLARGLAELSKGCRTSHLCGDLR